ncbi:MAG: proton-conducting transporter membrane subunit [Spirochaetaceae bacterium]
MIVSISVPGGIEASLLTVYLLMALLAAGASLAARELKLLLVALIHGGAAALTILASDLITLLIAWELLTLSAYAIIRLGGRESRSAAFWYLAAQISAAALFFVAIAIHAGATGSLAVEPLIPAAAPFMLLALLIKTAMMPLHGWLVGSYTRAPLIGSFVLSAYATKVGVYTAARTLSFEALGAPLLTYIGAVMAVVAVIAALRQHSARKLLSYHIISQVGYMLAGVGLAPETAGVTAGLFHAVNHIIYKGLLFLVAAVAIDHFGHDDLRRMGGLSKRMPLVFLCAVVGAAAIVGVPGTSGYVSKELLKKSVGELGTILLIAASVGTALSFTKFLYLIFGRRSATAPAAPDNAPATAHHRATASAAGDHAAAPGRRERGLPASATRPGLLALAAASILIGVLPRVVPGVPGEGYYELSSVLWGVVPAVAGGLLWFPLRPRLVRAGRTRREEPALRGYLSHLFVPILLALRGSYRIEPQRAISVAVAGLFSLVILLVYLV